MTRRLARWGAVVLLALAVTITPMSVVFSAGRFETRLPGSLIGWRTMSATLQDQTGLVRSISPSHSYEPDGVANPNGNKSILVVSWLGGCGDMEAQLSFRRDGSGYVVTERTFSAGCFYMIGIGRSVAIHLWSPVDAANVRLETD